MQQYCKWTVQDLKLLAFYSNTPAVLHSTISETVALVSLQKFVNETKKKKPPYSIAILNPMKQCS